MTDKPENPPAFPLLDQGGDGNLCMRDPGMSLRDYFASMALLQTSLKEPIPASEVARRAYELADAMLIERAKGGAK